MKFADQTGITELITLTKTALKPLEAFKNSVTDVNGIVKSNGSGGFSAAVAGRDYSAASHTHTTSQVEGLSSAIAEAEPFVVEVTLSSPTSASANKTFSEIKAASDAGRLCYVRANGTVAPLLGFKGLEGYREAIFSVTALVSENLMTSAIIITEGNSVTIENFSSQPLIRATGLLKGSGDGNISAAVAGTDYAAADHTHDYLPLSGGTLTGNLTGKYITGTWLQTTATGDKAGKFATIDNDGWIYYRTPAEVLSDIGAASASHNHSASNITSGTLPVARGGTGATNAVSARSNLGAQARAKTLTLSLTTAGWSATSKTQTKTASGVAEGNIVIISPAPTSQDAYSAAGVKCTAQGNSSLTFSCESIPTEALSVNVVIL